MLILCRDIHFRSRVISLSINMLLSCAIWLLRRAGVAHAIIVVVNGGYGCMELSTQGQESEGWTKIYQEDEPEPPRRATEPVDPRTMRTARLLRAATCCVLLL